MGLKLANSTAALTALALLAAPVPALAQIQPGPVTPAPASPAPVTPAPVIPAPSTATAAPGTGQADRQQAPAPATTPGPTEAWGQVPAAVAELGLTDVEVSEGRRGQRVRGTLPGGVEIEAMVGPDGTLQMLRSEAEDAALPADVVARLVPQAVRDSAIYREIPTVTAVMVAPQGVMVGGKDAAGEDVRAGFSSDGTLQRFGRGEMERPDRRGPERGKGREGDRGDRREGERAGDGKHGKPHGDGNRRAWREGDRADGERRHGDEGDRGRNTDRGIEGGRDGDGDRPALDEASARSALEQAGYTQPGTILRAGPRTLAEAVNPAGEPVTVELNPRGEVVRETAR